MTKKELKKLILNELRDSIKKPKIKYLNKNDIYDYTQNTLDKILDFYEEGHRGEEMDDTLKQQITNTLALFARDILESIDVGINPRDILNNVNEALGLNK